MTLIGALAGNAYAEDNGFFLGISAGGAAAINADNGGGATGSTALSAGIKLGYQAFFSEINGIRFYLSGVGAYGFYPSATGNNIGNDLYILADINADYLVNWVSEEQFSSGLFMGFFTGALVGRAFSNSTGGNSTGITAGLNLGIRTNINDHHQVEFGVKGGFSFYIGNARTTGAVIAALTSYIYKF